MMVSDILNFDTLTTLKKICKFLRIKNYSSRRKNEIILEITKYHAMIKLQRWTRKILSKDCPISCEPVKYPCFAYKTPSNVLIYYNLEALRNFLIKTGDFRDPSTRTNYTDKQLLEIDNIYEYNAVLHQKVKKEKVSEKSSEKENCDEYFKSVYRASKNTRFYEKIKEKEQEQLLFERILDSVCDDIVDLINENIKDCLFTLNTMYLHDYRTHFRKLINRSVTHAEYVINKNIDNFNQLAQKEKKYTKKQFDLCEYVTLFMYQLREEIYWQ